MPKAIAEATHVVMDGTQLAMLLDGIDVRTVRRPTAWEPAKKRSA